MSRSRWEKWSAGTGLVFFAFIPALAVLAADQPGLDASANEVLRFEIEKNSSIHLYLILWCIALVPLLWFLGTLLGALRRAEHEDSSLPTIGLTGLVLGSAGIFTTIILEGAAAFRPRTYGPTLTKLLWDMSYVFQPVFGVGLAVFLTVVAVLVLRTRLLPRWFGWLTLLPAVANMVYVGQIAKNDGYFLGEPGFPAFVVWIALASILLVRALRPIHSAFERAAQGVP